MLSRWPILVFILIFSSISALSFAQATKKRNQRQVQRLNRTSKNSQLNNQARKKGMSQKRNVSSVSNDMFDDEEMETPRPKRTKKPVDKDDDTGAVYEEKQDWGLDE